MELRQWLAVTTPAARRIVRKIIQDAHPEPLHTHTIYARSQTVKLTEEEERSQTALHSRLLRRIGPAMPPNPIHPIRSIRYLKKVVLEDLAARNEIIKVLHKKPATEQELTHASSIRPLSRSQRKNRGALGPGRRPVVPKAGQANEWVWRIKTPEDVDCERMAEDKRLGRGAFHAQQKRGAMGQRTEKTNNTPVVSQMRWMQSQGGYFLPGFRK